MGLVEDSPLLGREVDRVLQALEDQIPVWRSKAVPAQGCQRQGVGCVVGEVETAL